MKRVLKKSLALILALTLVFGAAPLAVLVGLELPSLKDVFADKAEAATCGVLTYEVSNGKVTITDCDSSASGELVIPSSIDGYQVTSIGNNAFRGCDGLTSITIPDSVTSIDQDSFYNCTGLTSITIPDSVTSLGSWAFDGCTGLTSVTIGNSVTSIGYSAFYRCTGLTSVTIGDGVTSIGDLAFSRCTGLTNVYYAGDIAGWCSVVFDGSSSNPMNYADSLYISGKKVEGDFAIQEGVTSIGDYAFKNCTGLTSVTIPDSVTSIGCEALCGCTGLTSVTIPYNVTSIGSGAFSGCTGLKSITIGNGVTSIGASAFYDTGLYNDSTNWENNVLYIGNHLIDAKTNISGAYTIKTGTKTIADGAFSWCENLTNLTIPDSVTSIGSFVFSGCTGLKSITVDKNNQYYSNDDCGVLFNKDKTELIRYPIGNVRTEFIIPDSVTSIGSGAFYECIGLTSVTIGNGVTSIGDWAFRDCTGLTSVIIGNGVTSIGDWVFEDCTRLTSVTIPDSVTSIGDYAFRDCIWLKSVIIGKGLKAIGNNAFYNCTELKNIYYTGDIAGWCSIVFYNFLSNPMYYANSLYIDGNLVVGDFVIPDRVTSIGDYAFMNCTGLTSIIIPDSVTSIGDGAFSGCSNITTTYYSGTPEQWEEISSGSNSYQIHRNIVFECDSERPFYQGTCHESLTWTLYIDGELVIDGVGEMFNYSSSSNTPWYSKCSTIKSLTIGNGVTSIGEYAFSGCKDLASVTIGNGVASIGDCAFKGCTGLTNITIPDSVTSIGERAFYDCAGLTSLTVSENVTQIVSSAFAGCNNLKKIDFLGYTTAIADGSFQNCPNVVFYCKSGSSVQSFAERNCMMYALTDGEYSDMIMKTVYFSFYCIISYQGDSTSPKIPSFITAIGSNAFKDNSTVKTIKLPDSVSSIYSGAFSNCTSLERIVVPHTVTTIAPDAFSGTNATIVCYANSYAHQYAVEQGMNFELIGVTLNQTKVNLSVDECSIITATPEQEYLDSLQISWKSSSPSVAAVDENGKISALSQGTATIYALAPTGEALATCSVQVGYSFCVTIQNPSTKTISYKSGIILHATADNLPAGAKIVWEKDNDNFSMSDDGNGNCKIISKANGSTTFTAKVKLADGSIAKDSNGNEISAQVTMNSKAGFFDKIVAFFKGLFGGNKVLPQLFKGIF